MDKIERLELQRKKLQEKRGQIDDAICELDTKIDAERQEAVVKAAKAMNFSSGEYKNLSKAIRDGSVMEFLEEKAKEQESDKKNNS